MRINGKFYGDDARKNAIDFLCLKFKERKGVHFGAFGSVDAIETAVPGVGWFAKDAGESPEHYAKEDAGLLRCAWILIAGAGMKDNETGRAMYAAADAAICSACEDATDDERKGAATKVRDAWRRFWTLAFRVSGSIA